MYSGDDTQSNTAIKKIAHFPQHTPFCGTNNSPSYTSSGWPRTGIYNQTSVYLINHLQLFLFNICILIPVSTRRHQICKFLHRVTSAKSRTTDDDRPTRRGE